MEVQEALYRAGHDAGPADGVAGSKFDRAVRELQAERGLDVDGIVGPQTRAALGI
jgi:N-acetylmuramoyl-L-alanine amidase